MKKLHPLLLLLLLSGCLYKVPLKGNYPGKPVYGYSERPVDEVWNRLIDVVTDEGFDIKFIDKSSGLVFSDDLSLKYHPSTGFEAYTVEDKKGQLLNPHAYVVTERLNTSDPRMFVPGVATTKWSVVLREASGGRTAIKIALSDIKVYDIELKSVAGRRYQAHSLQNFENWLFNEIK